MSGNVQPFPKRVTADDAEHDAAERKFTSAKLRWLNRAMYDQRLAALDFRVAAYLKNHLNRDSGDAWPKQVTIARHLGVTRRSVQLALDQLEKSGLISIECKRGENHQNRYRLIASHANSITYVQVEEAKPVTHPPEKGRRTGVTVRGHMRNGAHEEAKSHSHQDTVLKPIENSSGARWPSSTDVLGPAGAVLRQRLGSDVFESWFGKGKVVIRSETPEIVTLSSSSRFVVSRIQQDYADHALKAWQAVSPTVKRVEFVVS